MDLTKQQQQRDLDNQHDPASKHVLHLSGQQQADLDRVATLRHKDGVRVKLLPGTVRGQIGQYVVLSPTAAHRDIEAGTAELAE